MSVGSPNIASRVGGAATRGVGEEGGNNNEVGGGGSLMREGDKIK